MQMNTRRKRELNKYTSRKHKWENTADEKAFETEKEKQRLGISGEYIFMQMNTRRKRELNKYTSNAGRKIDTYSVHIKCIFSHWKADRLWAGERSENRTCRKKAGGKRMSVSDGRKIDTYSVHIKCIFSHWKADRLWAGERSENRTCRKKAGGKRMSVSDGQTEDGK